MANFKHVQEQIHHAWGTTPIGMVCYAVVDMLSSKRGSQIRVINVATLESWTDKKFSYETLLDAAMFLSGRSPHLLDIQYVLHDAEDNEFPITREEIRYMRHNTCIIDPYSGESLQVSNPDDYISFYFKPSDNVRSLFHNE